MTPLEKWQTGERERVIKHPVEPAQLEIIIGHHANRRVFHYGVEVHGLHYNNAQLQRLCRLYGETLRVDFKYYEDDLSYIHVFDPFEKVYFKVEAIYWEYAHGLRLVQHQAIRRSLRDQEKDPDQRDLLLRSKQELQDIVTQAIHQNKMAKRKKRAVYTGMDSQRLDADSSFTSELISTSEEGQNNDELPQFAVQWRKNNGKESEK